jgi:P27 family predicted phage terminase small subunit
MGTLAKCDVAAICGYCEAYSSMVDNARRVHELGRTLVDANGKHYSNPAAIRLETAMNQLRQWTAALGLTARALLKSPKEEAAKTLRQFVDPS